MLRSVRRDLGKHATQDTNGERRKHSQPILWKIDFASLFLGYKQEAHNVGKRPRSSTAMQCCVPLLPYCLHGEVLS